MFNKIANITAGFSLASSMIEAGKLGVRKAKANAKHEVAIKDIRDYTGDSKLNTSSDKHNAMKEIIRKGGFFISLYKMKGAATGFARGFCEGMKPNIMSAGFAAFTLAAKGRTAKMVGVAGCAISSAWDFVKNGTNLFADKDTIEK